LLERNARLQADLTSAVEGVRASRRRLIEATTGERAALRQRLAERALPAIPAVAGLLRAVPDHADPTASRLIAQCRTELEEIAADLENLSRGLHPRGLTERGLTALGEIAAACPIPVTVSVPTARLPAEVESAVWYVCAEAVANLVKHSHADSAAIHVEIRRDQVVGEVTDDGVGGARLDPDGGLAGLLDRLAAVGGNLRLTSPPGKGTTVRMTVPLR